MFHYTIGIAGHIDHGKTTLTKHLTGIDTDRLKEEKERQISIETGFAHFTLPNGHTVGVVDVPGHERFIRQMIAGSAGIDLVLLVVAANEGVMPQTQEHLDILSILGIRRGIIVLTKIDLVEGAFVQLVEEEIRETVQHTFLAHAPIIHFNGKEGEGLAKIVAEIETGLATIPARKSMEPFRMPIDRSFTVKGAGTVVTGTIFEGTIRVGDHVRLLPLDRMARVRGLQVHHQNVQIAYAGQRTAMNLTGVDYGEIHRGDVLVAPEFLDCTQRVDGWLRLLPSIDFSLKHRSRVVVYTGTSEVEGMVLFFDRKELRPGEEAFVQFVLNQPIVVRRGDPFVLRRPTPTLTLGGGQIVLAYGQKYPIRAETAQWLQKMHEASTKELVIDALADRDCSLQEIQNQLTISIEQLHPVIQQLINEGTVIQLPSFHKEGVSKYIRQDVFVQSKQILEKLLNEYHQHNPMQKGMKRSECKERLSDWSEERLVAVIDALIAEKKLVVLEERLCLSNFLPKLPSHLQSKANSMMQLLHAQGREVTDWLVLADQVKVTRQQAEQIRRFLVEQGELIPMTDKWVWPRKTWEQTIQLLQSRLQGKTFSIAEVRDILGLSRKYIIPLMERCDQLGLTKRQGDMRIWLA